MTEYKMFISRDCFAMLLFYNFRPIKMVLNFSIATRRVIYLACSFVAV